MDNKNDVLVYKMSNSSFVYEDRWKEMKISFSILNDEISTSKLENIKLIIVDKLDLEKEINTFLKLNNFFIKVIYVSKENNENLFDLIIENLRLKKLTVIIPTQNIPLKYTKKILHSLEGKLIEKIIIVSPDQKLSNVKSKNKIIFEKVLPGTKIEKLKAADKYIDDNDYVLVIDGDDLFNEEYEPIYWGSDLTLSFSRKVINNGLFSKKNKIVRFDNKNFSWGGGGMPYFNNHSMIIKGLIFKKVNKIMSGHNFQRHEDAVRSLYYISFSESIFFTKEINQIPIIRRMFKNLSHTSKMNDTKEVANWIKNINLFISKNNYILSNDPIFRKSQISSLVEIVNSTNRLISKGMLSKNDLKINIDPLKENINLDSENFAMVYNFLENEKIKKINIGDYIQSLAALNIVNQDWKDLNYINRENLNWISANPKNKNVEGKVIANGWFSHSKSVWPVAEGVDPLFTSVHIKRNFVFDDENITNFKKYEPIGCRDLDTVRRFTENGIEAYFSGCLTMSFTKSRKKRRGILFVIDNLKVDDEGECYGVYDSLGIVSYDKFIKWKGSKYIINELKKEFSKREILNAEFTTQFEEKDTSPIKGFVKSEEWLKKISRKKMIVTTRIHTLMSAMSLGTPTIYIMINNKDLRFKGIEKYWNIIDFTKNDLEGDRMHNLIPINNEPINIRILRENKKIVNNNDFRILIKNEVMKIRKWWFNK